MAIRPHGKGQPFGEFVAAAYETCGEDNAHGFVQLAFDAHLVRFQNANTVRSLMKRLNTTATPS